MALSANNPRLSIACFCAVLLCLLGPGSRAFAQAASEMLSQGMKRYALAEFSASISVLKKAASATKDPRTLSKIHLYLGCNHLERRRPQLARSSFAKALALVPSLEPDPSAFKPHIVVFFQQTKAGLSGNLSLTSVPDEAEVRVNKRSIGKTPLARINLGIGKQILEVRKTGFISKEVSVVVFPGRAHDLKVSLQSLDLKAIRDRELLEDRKQKLVMANAGLGAGLASILVMSILYGVGVSQGNEAHDNYMAARYTSDIKRHKEEVVSASNKIAVGHLFLGLSAAALGFSIYHYATLPAKPTSEFESTVGLSSSSGRISVSVSGCF